MSVFITGGASGIGRAVALASAAAGADVFVADLNEQGATETVDLVRGMDRVADYAVCDVASEASLAMAIQQANQALNGLHAVVSVAGILQVAPLDEMSLDLFEHHLRVNLTANFLLARLTKEALKVSGRGSMTFVSSVGGLRGQPGGAAYNASKGGLVNLCRSLAAELAVDRIRVNCVCPGWIDTPFNDPVWARVSEERRNEMLRRIPVGRQGTPREVADLVVFLASDASAFTTGSVIVIDGGETAT